MKNLEAKQRTNRERTDNNIHPQFVLKIKIIHI